jgi:hypothetical protein
MAPGRSASSGQRLLEFTCKAMTVFSDSDAVEASLPPRRTVPRSRDPARGMCVRMRLDCLTTNIADALKSPKARSVCVRYANCRVLHDWSMSHPSMSNSRVPKRSNAFGLLTNSCLLTIIFVQTRPNCDCFSPRPPGDGSVNQNAMLPMARW